MPFLSYTSSVRSSIIDWWCRHCRKRWRVSQLGPFADKSIRCKSPPQKWGASTVWLSKTSLPKWQCSKNSWRCSMMYNWWMEWKDAKTKTCIWSLNLVTSAPGEHHGVRIKWGVQRRGGRCNDIKNEIRLGKGRYIHYPLMSTVLLKLIWTCPKFNWRSP